MVVGAGPAGLFAAYELVSKRSVKVLVIDKGKDINNRKCPSISRFIRCRECKPCNILCGLGGAGGLSDGKLNLKSDVGGNLEEFVSKDEADDLIKKIDNVFLEHGASKKLYEGDSLDLEKTAACHGIKFIPIPQRHIGSDRLPSVVNSIRNYLESKGVSFLLNTEVKQICCENGFKIILDDGKEIIAHLAGRLRMFRIKVLPGDKVTVETTPYDEGKGRIIYRGKQ